MGMVNINGRMEVIMKENGCIIPYLVMDFTNGPIKDRIEVFLLVLKEF